MRLVKIRDTLSLSGVIDKVIHSDERWGARQILWCYDRPMRLIEG